MARSSPVFLFVWVLNVAIIKHISQAMVSDLAGVTDFYYWKGIPVARTWPRKSTLPPTAAMLGARNSFVQSRVDLRSVSGAAREAWALYSVGKKQAWLDYYTSVYMRFWKDYKQYPPVVTDFTFFLE